MGGWRTYDVAGSGDYAGARCHETRELVRVGEEGCGFHSWTTTTTTTDLCCVSDDGGWPDLSRKRDRGLL